MISFVIISCKIQSKILAYRFVPGPSQCDTCKISNLKKSIIITSDSTLTFGVVFGGLGVSTTINYSMIGNVILTDSVDINGDKSYSEFIDEIFNCRLSFSKDSIINESTKEKFFTDRLLRSQNRIYKKPKCYIIINSNKRRLTSINAKRILWGIDTTYQKIIVLDKIQAKKEYGINTKFLTLKVIKK
jgi:hypothetical protein